jgi:hypothetical protein
MDNNLIIGLVIIGAIVIGVIWYLKTKKNNSNTPSSSSNLKFGAQASSCQTYTSQVPFNSNLNSYVILMNGDLLLSLTDANGQNVDGMLTNGSINIGKASKVLPILNTGYLNHRFIPDSPQQTIMQKVGILDFQTTKQIIASGKMTNLTGYC